MKYRLLAIGAAVLLSAHAANATTYFESIAGVASVGVDGVNDGMTVAASSFTAGTPDFSVINLALSAGTPGDGGSLLVYLVPDNGAGGLNGIAGLPELTTDGTGNFLHFNNAELLGSILDSSLSNSLSVVSINVASTITTNNKEYWVALVWNGGSSGEWSYEANATGIGTTGQNYDNTYGILSPASDTTGAYQMSVTTPEPATLAILGGGLAGLGYVRRRKPNKG